MTFMILCSSLLGQTVDSLIQLGNLNCFKYPDSSEMYYDQVLSIEPYNKTCIESKLNCYYQHKSYDKALGLINSLIEHDSSNADYYFMRGLFYDNLNDDSSSLKEYRRTLELDSNYSFAIFNIGAHYFNRAAILDTQLKNENGDTTKLHEEKDLCQKLGLKYLEKAYQIDPEDEITQFVLFEIYKELRLDKKRYELELRTNKNNNR